MTLFHKNALHFSKTQKNNPFGPKNPSSNFLYPFHINAFFTKEGKGHFRTFEVTFTIFKTWRFFFKVENILALWNEYFRKTKCRSTTNK